MSYPIAKQAGKPMEPYAVTGSVFGEDCSYGGTRWGIHLGEDAAVPVGTEVRSIGRGRVVYSALHPGTAERGNWGNIVIIAHKHPKTKENFFSLYGHLGTRFKERGETVALGEAIGTVGEGNTPGNGWWPPHLHFAIYTGPWKGVVLPGYWKEGESRTERSFWENPSEFIEHFPGPK